MLSIDEYRHTSFEGSGPEYVDGRLVERGVGGKTHSGTQRSLIEFFGALEENYCVFTFPGLHLHVSATRFRIPDVCVYVGGEPEEDIPTTPPFLVIEILSPDDRASDIQEKIDDYLAFGVPYIWVIDPRTRRGYMYTPEGARPATDGILRTAGPAIELPLERLWTI